MKLVALLMLAAVLQVSAKGFAQEKITIAVNNAPLEQVLNSIKKQSGFYFVYRPEMVAGKTISIRLTNATLKDALDQCLKPQKLAYNIVGNSIVISTGGSNKVVVNETSEVTNAPIDVKGRVLNEKGEPVQGVTVRVKGSDKISVTDANGEFAIITSDQNAVLLFSHISMEPFEIKVEGRRELAISLKSKISALDEMQVIAYGTTTKRFSTGNIASIKAVDIQKQPVSNPLSALQGRVPGLFITQTNGLPGGGISVMIQGQNSIEYGTDPLYVIDGVPFPSQRLSTNISSILGRSGTTASSQYGNPLNTINPNDIESIEVLKDADATSIYGSRAANGAVLITTKKGRQGKTRFDANFQNGWGNMTRRVDMLNTQEYIAARKEGLKNDNRTVTPNDYDINGMWDTTRYTDWQKELLGGTANYADAQFTVSGGSATTQYLFAGNYHRETTVFPGDFAYRKGSIHTQVSAQSPNQRFRLQFTGNFVTDKNLLPFVDFTNMAVNNAFAPDAPAIYNSDGSLNWAPNPSTGQSTWYAGTWQNNPIANIYRTVESHSANLVSNTMLSYQIFPVLEAKISLGYNKLDIKEKSKVPSISVDPFAVAILGNVLRSASYTNSTIATWLVEPQLNYKKQIAQGNFEALIGTTIQHQESNGETLNGQTFVSDLLLDDVKSAGSITVINSVASIYKYNALFARLNYNWAGKYIVNLSGRRDGSSRFGPKSQFHNFASAGASWIFSKENFIADHLKFVSFGKLRASYGTTGSDQIPDYLYLGLYPTSTVQVPYQGVNGPMNTRLTNPYLEWEETKKLQVGVDFGLLKDRVNITVNYYQNKSSNQLLQYSLPLVAGFDNIQRNLPATIQNYGWEIAANGQIFKTQNFGWTSSFNVTIPRNKLISFPGIEYSTYANSFTVGQPFTRANLYKYMGVNQSTGLYQFADKDGKPVNTDPLLGYTKINISPQLYGGFQNTFTYKNLELDCFFQFSRQTGTNFLIGTVPAAAFLNQPRTVLDRWQNQGQDAPIQKYFGADAKTIAAFRLAQMSDLVYSDASYIRLKNISLSWRLPQTWLNRMHLQAARLYMLGQNLATITNYVGLDPETRSPSSLPPLRVITIGVQIGF